MKKYTTIHKARQAILSIHERATSNESVYPLKHTGKFVLHIGNKLSDLIYLGRDYEPLETRYCIDFLQPGDIAFDIGANIGYFSAVFSKRVSTSGQVIAFEPGFHTYGLLSRTIKRLGLQNVLACPYALWNRDELITFNNSSIGDDAQQSIGDRTKLTGQSFSAPVCAVTGDTVMNTPFFKQLATPTLVKIDVEGAEPQVLDGFSQLIGNKSTDNPVLLIECNKEALNACNNTPSDVIDRLSDQYDLHFTRLFWPPWYTEDTGFLPVDLTRIEALPSEINILGIPKRGRNRRRALASLDAIHR